MKNLEGNWLSKKFCQVSQELFLAKQTHAIGIHVSTARLLALRYLT